MVDRFRLGSILLLVLLGAEGARAAEAPPIPIVGINNDAFRRFTEAKKKVDEKKYSEALDDFQALINTAGNDLVPLAPNHFVQIRWLCHRAIAALPLPVLRIYRQRVDMQARKLFDQAGEPGDERVLRRLVDEYFCSRPAEAALHRLGDLAFERGRFAEADRWWLNLQREDLDGPARLIYPFPEGKPALVRAKILLSRWFRNDRVTWKIDLDTFRKLYPNAEGTLGGKTGKLADLLIELTANEKDPVQAARQWLAFAGNSSRTVLLPDEPTHPAKLARLARLGQHLQFPLGSAAERGKVGSVTEAARTLAFHPLLVDGQVLVADARQVTGYDLHSGKKEIWVDANAVLGNFEANRTVPAPPDLRYTLTVAEDCVLARLGVQEIRPDKEGPTCIVCLERHTGKRLRWHATLQNDGGPTYFEGTPVVQGRSAYVAVTRIVAGHTITAIHCYPLDARGAATPRWKRDVCKSRELQGTDARTRHHLLTIAGPNVVYCSHSGAIVALDTDTGRRSWAVSYAGKPERTGRDLVPCVYAGGRLFVAPADLDCLFALDALTGERLWERDAIQVQQILGVARSRLFFTSLTPRAGLRAINVTSGSDRMGWSQPGDGGSLPTFGQGFLAGDRVYWPTTEGIYVLNQFDGQVPDDPTQLKGIPSGNLAFGEDCLAVADRTTLHVFTPAAFELEQRRKDAERTQGSALSIYRLGLAQRELGQWREAVASLTQAAKEARPGEWAQGCALAETARREHHGTLLDAATAAGRAADWTAAANWLKSATAAPFTPAERALALQRTIALWEQADKPERALAVCQQLLNDPLLQGERLRDERGLAQQVRLWATRRMDRLLAQHGRGIYASFEKEAGALLEGASERGERLRQLLQRYPHAQVTHQHLLELATVEEKAKRPGPAAAACREWLRRASTGTECTEVEAQLARLLQPVAPTPRPATLALELPLERSWQHDGHGAPMTLATSGAFFCQHAGAAFDLNLQRLWSAETTTRMTWVGHEAELALLGQRDELSAITVQGGDPRWRYSGTRALSEFVSASGRVFALEQQRRLLAFDAFTGELLWQCAAPAAFRVRTLPGGRFDRIARATDRFVFARLGDGRIWKLDAASGELLAEEPPTSLQQVRFCDAASGTVRWTHLIEGRTTLNGEPPHLLVRGTQTLLLTGRNYAHTLQRLDNATGKPLWENEVILGEAADGRSFSVDDHACYFVHAQHVKALALTNSANLWSYPLPGKATAWRTLRAGNYLLVWPIEKASVRFLYRTVLGSLEWRVGKNGEERPGAGLPLLLLDARTGKLVQRLNLAVAPGTFDWRLRGWWQNEPLPALAPPQVIVHAGGLVVLSGSQAWGFQPTPK